MLHHLGIKNKCICFVLLSIFRTLDKLLHLGIKNKCICFVLLSIFRNFAVFQFAHKVQMGQLHMGKASLMLCFWQLKITTEKTSQEHCGGECYGCSIYSPECAEGKLCPHAHFWDAYILTSVGIQDSVSFTGQVVVNLELRASR